MNRSIQDIPIAMVGAGNLATHVARALYNRGFRIVQVYSRTTEAAATLAAEVEADYTTRIADITTQAQLYIVALTDTALTQLLPDLVQGRTHGLWVHTAGSIAASIWQGQTERYGVLYPMQTFSKQSAVDFTTIPVFIESSTEADTELLFSIARCLSGQVYRASSEQRKILHLAAVFTCNFTNHLYTLAHQLLSENQLPFEAMLPLIDETARKIHLLPPAQAQTGPAIRHDYDVINNHLSLLDIHPQMQTIYRIMTESIQRKENERLRGGMEELRE